MRQGSPSFQGFSVLKGTFPELCGSPLLLLFVAFDDSVNFWMLQFLQMGLILIVTWLEIQQRRESGDLCYFCLLASQWMRQLCPAGSSSYLTVIKQLEKKLRVLTSGVNVFRLTDRHIPGGIFCVHSSRYWAVRTVACGWQSSAVWGRPREWLTKAMDNSTGAEFRAKWCCTIWNFSSPFWLVKEDRDWQVCL